ncbi:hypothetical protein [Candidatus Aquiluna sp. UB-MaderosW2red]|uniref:hypothetical protein n=1 Tax=Candidatus Aquiluna sp. UB-MaderosW2red TaxID=1855377 RepID=UPI000875DBCB|nr:hypothetical protein [Candidatus Aquiluna sp. UB-MaderosW2red]SCX05577.1 hypothetical protein SAMN05216534_0414 [Candidatus Aquiluna sp. UB-MaderosW2red]
MKKLIAGLVSVAVLTFGLVPAQGATKYVAKQKTLSSFSASATGLTPLQRSQVEQAVEANAYAEKFICTGVRYYEQAMSVNITVRKRAKAACDYAKELNPELSTWYQTKSTAARSYSGRVLLTIRTDDELANLVPSHNAETGSIDQDQPQNWGSLALPLEACQLRETKNFLGGQSKGFPVERSNRAVGNVKIAIIPVDFSNALGEGSPAELFKEDIRLIGEWAKHFSRGKLTYEIEFNAKSWIRAPKEAQWYTCAQCGGAPKELQPKNTGVQQMIAAADMAYDFEGVEIIYFIFPADADRKFGTTAYGFNQNFSSQDGPITASIYGDLGWRAGNRPANATVWDHAIHEILHFQGFVGHGPSNGSGHYITSNQWGPSKAVTSWEAFLNGWFDEEEILCLDKKSLEQELFITMDSIDTFGDGKESVMVRLNAEELIVIERREPGPFTKICSNCNASLETGFTAYRVNVNGPHYRDDRDPSSYQKNFWSFLGDNKKPKIDDSVEYQGVRITRISDKQMKLSLD